MLPTWSCPLAPSEPSSVHPWIRCPTPAWLSLACASPTCVSAPLLVFLCSLPLHVAHPRVSSCRRRLSRVPRRPCGQPPTPGVTIHTAATGWHRHHDPCPRPPNSVPGSTVDDPLECHAPAPALCQRPCLPPGHPRLRSFVPFRPTSSLRHVRCTTGSRTALPVPCPLAAEHPPRPPLAVLLELPCGPDPLLFPPAHWPAVG